MKIEQTPRDDHQMAVTVELEAERMEAARRKAARKIAQKTKIPGFRPGKAPYDVVRRYYGDGAINEEAIEVLVDEVYPEMLKEAGIEPAASGQLENIESLDPPRFQFVVPLRPVVDLGGYRAIRKPYTFVAPDESKVQESLQDLRRMYATTETVERAIQDGDFVLVDVKGEKAKAKEGDDLSSLSRNSYAVLVREGERDDDWPFAGFPAKLLGLKPGDTREFKHKFPKDHADEALAGASVTFSVTVKTVRGMTLPALDDEFAKMVGGGDTLDQLMENMRLSLERQAKSEYDDKYFTELIEDIKAVATLKYPPQVLEHESGHVLDELKRRLSQQGMEFDTYLKMRETDESRFVEEEVMPVAKKRLERSLIIDEVARVEKIQLDEETLKNAFQETWSMLATSDEEFAKATKGGTRASKELVDAVALDSANRLIVERVLEHLKLSATGQLSDEAPAEEKPAKKLRAKKAGAEGQPTEETAPEAESKPKKKAKKTDE